MTPLTWLYVPGDRPERVRKALASGAHAVIVDLEDAVAPEAKPAARRNLALLFETEPVGSRARPGQRARDRMGKGGPRGGCDAAGARSHAVKDAFFGRRRGAARLIGCRLTLHCLIESALGVEHALEIASHERVAAISLGEADLRSEIGGGDAALDWARSRVINAAVAAGLPRHRSRLHRHSRSARTCGIVCARSRVGLPRWNGDPPGPAARDRAGVPPTSGELARAREILAADARTPEERLRSEGSSSTHRSSPPQGSWSRSQISTAGGACESAAVHGSGRGLR